MTQEEREAIRAKIAELQALVDAPAKRVIRHGRYAWDGKRLTIPAWGGVDSCYSGAFAALVESIGVARSDGNHIAAILTQLYADGAA